METDQRTDQRTDQPTQSLIEVLFAPKKRVLDPYSNRTFKTIQKDILKHPL
jgi:hypothetical protein